MKQFDFSVIMAVYNVEAYLREAVESLIHQSIGFHRIQVILVDDGSTDGSGKICDEYKKKYPDNFVIIHKENGRQASARNAGLPYAEGRYVNFLDPDDTLERHALEKVRSFMDSHEETDVCCIPMFFFGTLKGPHILNYKFDNGTAVVNLMDTDFSDYKVMSVSSSFFRNHVAKGMVFDTELFIAEDAKEILKILIRKPIVGLVTGTQYNYRKYGNSTLNKSLYNKEFYTAHLIHFSLWAFDEAQKKYGYVPRFVQNIIMYDLQWKWNQASIPSTVLSETEKAEYKSLLVHITAQIDDEVILEQQYINVERKCLILNKKHGENEKPRLHTVSVKRIRTKQKSFYTGDIELYFHECRAATVSDMETVLEFLTIDNHSHCIIEGYHRIYGLEDLDIRPLFIVDKDIIYGQIIDRPKEITVSLGENASRTVGFRCEFNLNNKAKIVPGIEIGDIVIPRRHLEYGYFFPVTDLYSNSYVILNNKLVRIIKNTVCVSDIPNHFLRIKQEFRLLSELWRRDLLGGRKAIGGRLFYHLIKPFKRRKLWIISDRITKADDNGEALFCYLMEHKPKDTDIIFAISRRSGDYTRIEQFGKCINAMSFRHKLLHLLCDIVISSHAESTTRNPYHDHDDGLRDLLTHQKFVFLQHGITKDDISGWLNRYNQNMVGFVTAAKPEWDSIVHGDYYYSEDKVWLTGFPRYDRLYHDEKKLITVMPTWRRYLTSADDKQTGTWSLNKEFEQSEYYKFFNELLNSERLLTVLSEYGYTLQFFPHPNLQADIKRFHHDKRVNFLTLNTSYRDVYATSNLVLTDYSSAVFDFAYLRKPVIYCQFDHETFFEGEHTFTKGYFDYERDGLGEVTYNLDDTIDLLIDYVKNDCEMKEKYRERADQFFAFHDRENCRRVVDKIKEMMG